MNNENKSEYAINMKLSKMLILQGDNLDNPAISDYFDENSSCHIYFISRRPRVTLDVSKTKIDTKNISLTFRINNRGEVKEKSLIFKNIDNSENVKVVSEYPYTFFRYYNQKGELTTNANVSVFLQTLPRDFSEAEFLDLEILYIGQSYGKEGEKNAIDRLKNHQTLQRIYAESIINNPDDDIWISLCNFEEIGAILIDGRQDKSESDEKSDVKRLSDFIHKFTNDLLNEKQKVNFTEAALIKYFEPPYNKDFVDIFPSITHSSYKECYALDINSVIIELNTDEIVNCNFYSSKIPKRKVHLNSFWFHNVEERKSLFQLNFNGILDTLHGH